MRKSDEERLPRHPYQLLDRFGANIKGEMFDDIDAAHNGERAVLEG
jgi:hypothetical protein